MVPTAANARWERSTNALRRAASNLTSALATQRLQLAAKAALAAGVAFWVAPLMPGAAAHYPYYAPLGALVVMYHNVAGSVRQGLQALAGLAVGIGLAFVLVTFASPSPLSVALVMGVGVLLSGLPWIGSGSDWIPTAALLVLLIGGSDPDDFSLGYLTQMGVGVLVGVAVNFLVFPPLHIKAAASSLTDLHRALGQQLMDMGAALTEQWPPEHELWSSRSDELAAAAGKVRHLVQEADASRRANVRRKLHPRDIDQDYQDLRNLETVTFHIRDMTDVLNDVIWESEAPYEIPIPDCGPIATAMSATGNLLVARGETDSQVSHERFETAEAAVRTCMAATTPADPDRTGIPTSDSLLLSLHRIVRALAPAS